MQLVFSHIATGLHFFINVFKLPSIYLFYYVPIKIYFIV